jgi:predicted DNA-binding transcriptional regulator YafY
VIRRDVLAREHNLSERQALALGYIIEHEGLSIQIYEKLFPAVNRRTLQRDLKAMVDKGIFLSEGATNQLIYRLKG